MSPPKNQDRDQANKAEDADKNVHCRIVAAAGVDGDGSGRRRSRGVAIAVATASAATEA
jgi:hypothetical protein